MEGSSPTYVNMRLVIRLQHTHKVCAFFLKKA